MNNNLDNIKEELASIQKKGYQLMRVGEHIMIVDPNNLGDICFDMYTKTATDCKVTFNGKKPGDPADEDLAMKLPSGESTVINAVIKDGKVEPIIIDAMQSMSTVLILCPDTDTVDASAINVVVKPLPRSVVCKPSVEIWVVCKHGAADVKWPDGWKAYDFDLKCSNTSSNDAGMTSIYAMQLYDGKDNKEPEVVLDLLCIEPIENNK